MIWLKILWTVYVGSNHTSLDLTPMFYTVIWNFFRIESLIQFILCEVVTHARLHENAALYHLTFMSICIPTHNRIVIKLPLIQLIKFSIQFSSPPLSLERASFDMHQYYFFVQMNTKF